VVAGLLLVIAFLMSFVQAIALFMASAVVGLDFFAEAFAYDGLITLLLSILTLIGALFALSGRGWWVAIAGAVFAILATGILFLSTSLGIVALIVLAMSRREFKRGASPAPPPTGDVYGGTMPGQLPPS